MDYFALTETLELKNEFTKLKVLMFFTKNFVIKCSIKKRTSFKICPRTRYCSRQVFEGTISSHSWYYIIVLDINKTHQLGVASHVTSFNQSECFISALGSYATLKFVDDINSRCYIIILIHLYLQSQYVNRPKYYIVIGR